MRKIAKQSGLLLVALVGLVFTSAGQTSLFNGKDLSGWIVYGTEKWYVEDGILVSESGPDAEYGYLGTEKDYKDFELTAKFKQDQDGNSGIFFRSTFEGTKVSGWQVEVAPPGNDTGGVYESYGRGWLIKPATEKDKYLKFGEWNDIKVRVKGDRVVTWLNGKKMVDFSDEKIGQGEGQIALQIHSGGGLKISWKDIEVKEL